MKEMLFSWGMLVVSVFFNVYGIFVIKMRFNEQGPIQLDSVRSVVHYFFILMKSPLVVSGLVLFFVAPFLFAVALSRMQISVAYPAQIGLNFLFLIILAMLFLGEHLTVPKAVGIILIFAGIYFLNKTG